MYMRHLAAFEEPNRYLSTTGVIKVFFYFPF